MRTSTVDPSQPRVKADLVENVSENTIMYGLIRRWDQSLGSFEYILRASLPVAKEMVEIKLDKDIAQILGSYWKQNDYGTFIGRHCMDWIIRHLKAGLEI